MKEKDLFIVYKKNYYKVGLLRIKDSGSGLNQFVICIITPEGKMFDVLYFTKSNLYRKRDIFDSLLDYIDDLKVDECNVIYSEVVNAIEDTNTEIKSIDIVDTINPEEIYSRLTEEADNIKQGNLVIKGKGGEILIPNKSLPEVLKKIGYNKSVREFKRSLLLYKYIETSKNRTYDYKITVNGVQTWGLKIQEVDN